MSPDERAQREDFKDLRTGVEWFKSFMTTDEWSARRLEATQRFYEMMVGNIPDDVGRYFSNQDSFGWYLFLGEAFNDHPWNYEVFFGSRVIPLLAAIGRNLDTILKIEGIENRVKRIVGPEKSQPNGGLFEILVANAYVRDGADVAFRPELPGRQRTHDLDVHQDSKLWAVECKRMEKSEYGERERIRIRELWKQPGLGLAQMKRSVIADVKFKIELFKVPDDYLLTKTKDFVRKDMPSLLWDDSISYGIIGDLDLDPVQMALRDSVLMHPSSRLMELITGSYRRNDNNINLLNIKRTSNPHFIDEIDTAVILRWQNQSEESIERKAKDILKKLAEASDQLPEDTPAAIHIGIEAVDGDDIERRRYEKICATAESFDPGKKQLEYIYCHYFVPEAPPDEAWAFDETFQWIGRKRDGPRLQNGMLVVPGEATRQGMHWDGKSHSIEE